MTKQVQFSVFLSEFRLMKKVDLCGIEVERQVTEKQGRKKTKKLHSS